MLERVTSPRAAKPFIDKGFLRPFEVHGHLEVSNYCHTKKFAFTVLIIWRSGMRTVRSFYLTFVLGVIFLLHDS